MGHSCVLLQIGAMSFGVALMQKTEAMDFDSIVLDVVSLEREGGIKDISTG